MTEARVQFVSQKLDDFRRVFNLPISCAFDTLAAALPTGGIFEHVDDRRILVGLVLSFDCIRMIFGCDNKPSLNTCD